MIDLPECLVVVRRDSCVLLECSDGTSVAAGLDDSVRLFEVIAMRYGLHNNLLRALLAAQELIEGAVDHNMGVLDGEDASAVLDMIYDLQEKRYE